MQDDIGECPQEWLHGETLNRHDVARIFNVDPSTVTRWAKDGVIGFFRSPGGARIFPEAEVRRILRDEAPSRYVTLNAERDKEKYRRKWQSGWRNNGMLDPFGHKEAAARKNDDDDDE